MSRNQLLRGHRGAMRSNHAPSSRTLWRTRGMRVNGGKAYALIPVHLNENASIRHAAVSCVLAQYRGRRVFRAEANRST